MASLSVEGERSTLALIAEQYAQIVELRIALSTERQQHELTREALGAAAAELSNRDQRKRRRSAAATRERDQGEDRHTPEA